jgi:hypothetical protein
LDFQVLSGLDVSMVVPKVNQQPGQSTAEKEAWEEKPT